MGIAILTRSFSDVYYLQLGLAHRVIDWQKEEIRSIRFALLDLRKKTKLMRS